MDDFKGLRIIAATMDVKLNQNLNINAVFEQLPIYKGDFRDKLVKRNAKSTAITDIPPDGTILSAKKDGEVRGRPPKLGHMRNMIIVRMVHAGRVVSMNVGGNNIHICGMTREEEATEIAETFMSVIINTQALVTAFREDFDFWCSWLTVHAECQGKSTLYPKIEERKEYGLAYLPSDKDPRLCEYLLSYAAEYNRDDLYNALVLLYTSGDMVTDTNSLQILSARSEMVRYRYELPFSVDKLKLCQFLVRLIEEDSAASDWGVVYEASTMNYIQLIIPEHSIEGKNSNGRKKQPSHKFNISHKGTVDQYSPSSSTAELAYEIFTEIMLAGAEYFKLDDDDVR